MGLQRYKEKRNFRATPEPEGKVERRTARGLKFVIQKHAATRLHYDFRLELDGVLLSWAVPKGIPTTKGDRKLAMHVEDHPLSYGDFEGIIPEGNYGAGSVMVWDTGIWEPVEGDAAKAMRDGKLKFTLRGKKLNGEWTLVRMREREKGKDEWLLIKSGDDVRPISARADDQSALTGRTMEQIAGQKTRTWKSHRAASEQTANNFRQRIAEAARRTAKAKGSRSPRSVTVRTPRRAAASRSPKKKESKEEESAPVSIEGCPAEAAHFIEPMKARLVESLPSGEDWLLELKHDGYRALAVRHGDSVELYSRNRRLMNSAFPGIVAAVKRLSPAQFVIDGEIVALNKEGHGSFQLLQNRENITDNSTLVFYVFDVLNLGGRNVRGLPLTDWRELVQQLTAGAGEPIRFSATVKGDPATVLAHVKNLGLEGLIAKKPNSKYEPGQRSGSWVKLKCVDEQEFVIGGYTPPKGSRDFFGALLVGYYDGDRLMFASKVGSGYTQATLRELHRKFQPSRQVSCPFVNLPTKRSGKFGQGVTASEMRLCTWLEPKLVAQVRFTEWTSDGGLRHPVFLGLRHDKPAEEVTRESAQSSGK